MRALPSHGAYADMGVFVLRCNLGSSGRVHIGKTVAMRQRGPRPYGNARALVARGRPAPQA